MDMPCNMPTIAKMGCAKRDAAQESTLRLGQSYHVISIRDVYLKQELWKLINLGVNRLVLFGFYINIHSIYTCFYTEVVQEVCV